MNNEMEYEALKTMSELKILNEIKIFVDLPLVIN